MSYKYGQVSSMFDLLDNIIETAALDGWTNIRSYNLTYNSVSRLGGVILKSTGDGNDAIYIEIGINPVNFTEFILDSSVGEDTNLQIWEQPGSIQQWNKVEDDETTGLADYTNKKVPAFSITDGEQFNYFIFSNSYRIIVVCRMAVYYQSMYLGFINPISSEKQYPYPMYVAGNNVVSTQVGGNSISDSFVFPSGGTGYLRRADGMWRIFNFPYSTNTVVGTEGVYPYDCNNTSLVPEYTSTVTTDVNFLIMPVMLYTITPIDISGALRGVYWLSGTRDIASEQVIVVDNVQYLVFDTGSARGNNSYFCIQIETS